MVLSTEEETREMGPSPSQLEFNLVKKLFEMLRC